MDKGIHLELLREAIETLRGSLAARGYAREGAWIPSAANLKISDDLRELLRPYLSADTDLIEARVLALLGGIAWNLAVAPEVGEEERQELRMTLTPTAAIGMDRVLRAMRSRKRKLFPKDRRVITQTYVHQQSDGSLFFTAAALS